MGSVDTGATEAEEGELEFVELPAFTLALDTKDEVESVCGLIFMLEESFVYKLTSGCGLPK